MVINSVTLNRVSASGLNRYVEGLVTELLPKQNVTAYTSIHEFKSLYTKVNLVPPSLSEPSTKANFRRFLWYQTSLPLLLAQQNADLFYSPVPEGMLFPVCKQIITVADLVAVLFPEFMPVQKYYFRYILPRLLKVSTAVVAISEATKRDVEHHYAPMDKPIHVVYPSYDEQTFFARQLWEAEAVKNKYGLDQFILSVGEMRPYKNIRRLIEAFSRLEAPQLKLAIVGKVNKLDPGIMQLPATLGITEKVKFLDYVSDHDLAALYSSARLFIFPSLYEGFGIPLLEAMACKCPIISSNSSSLPEVAGDAAIYFDPTNVDDIAKKIRDVSSNEVLRQSLIAIGAERVKSFTYKISADKVMKLYNEIAEPFKS